MATKFPKFSQDLAQDPTTRRIWYGIATAHDFESHDGMTEENLYQKIFASHFGHIAIIFLWASGSLFHVAWQGNFEQWIKDPLNVRPIAHAIWDPQFGKPAVEAFTQVFITGGTPLGCGQMVTYIRVPFSCSSCLQSSCLLVGCICSLSFVLRCPGLRMRSPA
jgi:hypothetical protein